jgi:hypothetical protein
MFENICEKGSKKNCLMVIRQSNMIFNDIDCFGIQNGLSIIECHKMDCITLKCNVMQCHAMPCNAMQCNAMQCNAMRYNRIESNRIE